MSEYHKINSLYKRDPQGKFIGGEFSSPEFAYLYDAPWMWTEKVDGTNIRLDLSPLCPHAKRIQGRTDNAELPARLYPVLEEAWERLVPVLPDGGIVYGEGYGARVQKGGGNYKADGVAFVMFDVRMRDLWLLREDVEDIAKLAGVDVVPIVHSSFTPRAMEVMVAFAFRSAWGDFDAEGVVGIPIVPLLDRRGQRIITKLKTKDYQ